MRWGWGRVVGGEDPTPQKKKKKNKKRFEKITVRLKQPSGSLTGVMWKAGSGAICLRNEGVWCVKEDTAKDNKVENRRMTLVRPGRRAEDGDGKWSGSSPENTSGLNLFRLLSQNCQSVGGL